MSEDPANVRFEVLGPLRAVREGEELALGGPRQQAVLAALLLRAGRPVSRDDLVDAVWGPEPPPTAANLIHTYVAHLRKILEPARARGARGSVLASAGPGYVLRLAAGQLDMQIAEQQLDVAREARVAGDLPTCAAALDTALALWHGTPLAGIPGPLASIERDRLAELRLAALENRAETLLGLNQAADVTGELSALAASYPFRERLVGLLMRALYRSGRQAEALAAYQRVRRRLVDELGVEPGPELQHLHNDILNCRELAGLPEPGRAVSNRTTPPPPRQLPPAVRHFTGRKRELAALTILAREAARAGGTVVISAISGTAGVGKTALAIHFAHEIATSFPDGQLYVDLRGFAPSGTPVGSGEALRGFLEGLAVAPERIPQEPQAQVGLYRSLLAGKRLVVVLDNASSEDQVRPLLPGANGCLVIVTSRSQLTGLAAADGAQLLSLNPLPHDEAYELLARRLGHQRSWGEPGAVNDLVQLCGRLPLALVVAAARAAARPEVPLSAIATELGDSHTRLDALDAGEAATSVRAVFSWSYQKLDQASARMFRLLGIHPGPSISTAAAASLAGVPPRQAGQALGQLVGAHLVSEPVPGRFGCHDLLRAYAAELAYAVDGAPARRAAMHRVLDHYLHTAHAVDCLLDPAREHASLGAPESGTSPQHPAGRADAIAWLEAEKPALLAAVTYAAAHGFDSHAWQIPWTLGEFFDRRGYWADWAAIQQMAFAAACRQDHLAGQAHASRDIGRALARLGRYDEAHPHLQAALDLRAQLGDPAGQAAAHVALGSLSLCQNRHLEALDHARRAHDLYTAAGNRAGQANALGNMGWCYTLAGDYDRAIDCCRQAVELHRGLNDRFGEAHNWDSLGYAYYHRGDHAEALRYYQRSVDLFRELADRHHEADILGHIGDAQTAIGNPQAARDAWQRALAICDDLGSANAEEIRAKLGRPQPAAPQPGG